MALPRKYYNGNIKAYKNQENVIKKTKNVKIRVFYCHDDLFLGTHYSLTTFYPNSPVLCYNLVQKIL